MFFKSYSDCRSVGKRVCASFLGATWEEVNISSLVGVGTLEETGAGWRPER